MQKMPSKMEVAPQCTQKLKVGRKVVWIWKLSSFLVFENFSKTKKRNFKFSRILEKFHFLISISSHFHFTFHFSKTVNQIFISLFTSRKEWNQNSIHFSFLEKSEKENDFTFHFSKKVKAVQISLFFLEKKEWNHISATVHFGRILM